MLLTVRNKKEKKSETKGELEEQRDRKCKYVNKNRSSEKVRSQVSFLKELRIKAF